MQSFFRIFIIQPSLQIFIFFLYKTTYFVNIYSQIIFGIYLLLLAQRHQLSLMTSFTRRNKNEQYHKYIIYSQAVYLCYLPIKDNIKTEAFQNKVLRNMVWYVTQLFIKSLNVRFGIRYQLANMNVSVQFQAEMGSNRVNCA